MELLETIEGNFKEVTEKPESFLSNDFTKSYNIEALLKTTYDYQKSLCPKENAKCSLPLLMVTNFDTEQIWQQLELQNTDFFSNSIAHITRLIVRKSNLVFTELETEGPHEEETENHAIDEQSDDEYSQKMEISTKQDKDNSSDDTNESSDSDDNIDIESDSSCSEPNEENDDGFQKRAKPSEVDDEFFKLDEMEKFLDNEEKRIDSKSESKDDGDSDSEEDGAKEIDFFAPMSDEADDDENDLISKNPRYHDFFVKSDEHKKDRRNKFLEEQEMLKERNDVAENQETVLELEKSGYEMRQERLKKKIGHLENAALAEKPWQLKGEITAENRPENSLLENILEFDMSTRPAPLITQETTLKLEDMIRQRIKDKVFDSVERKVKPVETPFEYKKRLVLDQEKSKESLAQIYEKEYLKQKDAIDPEAQEDKEEEEPPLHKDIREMMSKLFAKLDALANYHYTPKIVAAELKIISNLPAINMEEVAPVATSDATMLAPEEVQRKKKGELMGKEERTDTDKKRERRKKKRKQHVHAVKKQQDLLKPGLGNKYTKAKAKKLFEQVTKEKNVDKMTDSGKTVKSSTAFFSQLQDEVKSSIKNKVAQKKKNANTSNLQAKKFKL